MNLVGLLRQYASLSAAPPGAESSATLPEEVADWPSGLQEAYQERAAIMEFDGNLSREEAEQQARIVIIERAGHVRAETSGEAGEQKQAQT